ncbi:hypothetical protein B296_00025175, partial [Ensete ventricosum]
AMNINVQVIKGNRHSSYRRFSIFNEFSKQLKGEAKSFIVSENVRDQLSAAKEEVKDTLGLGKQEPSTTSNSSSTSSPNDGSKPTSEAEIFQNFKANSNEESSGETETLFGKFKSTVSSASPTVSQAFQKLTEAKITNLARKGYEIVKDELSSNQTRKKRMQYASASVSSEPRSTRTDIVVVPTKKSLLGEKWEAFKKKVNR